MKVGVPVAVAVIIGVAAGLAARPGGAEQPQLVGDADRGVNTEAEALGCAAQRFDLSREVADGRAEEKFAAAVSDVEVIRRQFGQADRDGDGRISRDEWLAWFGPAYAGARQPVPVTD